MSPELQIIFTQLLTLVILLNGISIIIGGPTMAGRLNRWIWRHCVSRPIRAIIRSLGRFLIHIAR
jgi:hypothetical protein